MTRDLLPPALRVDQACSAVAEDLNDDERADQATWLAMADTARAWARVWGRCADEVAAARVLEDHPSLFP